MGAVESILVVSDSDEEGEEGQQGNQQRRRERQRHRAQGGDTDFAETTSPERQAELHGRKNRAEGADGGQRRGTLDAARDGDELARSYSVDSIDSVDSLDRDEFICSPRSVDSLDLASPRSVDSAEPYDSAPVSARPPARKPKAHHRRKGSRGSSRLSRSACATSADGRVAPADADVVVATSGNGHVTAAALAAAHAKSAAELSLGEDGALRERRRMGGGVGMGGLGEPGGGMGRGRGVVSSAGAAVTPVKLPGPGGGRMGIGGMIGGPRGNEIGVGIGGSMGAPWVVLGSREISEAATMAPFQTSGAAMVAAEATSEAAAEAAASLQPGSPVRLQRVLAAVSRALDRASEEAAAEREGGVGGEVSVESTQKSPRVLAAESRTLDRASEETAAEREGGAKVEVSVEVTQKSPRVLVPASDALERDSEAAAEKVGFPEGEAATGKEVSEAVEAAAGIEGLAEKEAVAGIGVPAEGEAAAGEAAVAAGIIAGGGAGTVSGGEGGEESEGDGAAGGREAPAGTTFETSQTDGGGTAVGRREAHGETLEREEVAPAAQGSGLAGNAGEMGEGGEGGADEVRGAAVGVDEGGWESDSEFGTPELLSPAGSVSRASAVRDNVGSGSMGSDSMGSGSMASLLPISPPTCTWFLPMMAASSSGISVEFHIIRHGESTQSPALIAGRSPAARLTPMGCQQAMALGTFLRRYLRLQWDEVHCSPIPRATHTARLVCQELGFPTSRIQEATELQEMSAGDWEGKPRAEFFSSDAARAWMTASQPDFCYPGGESQRQVECRMVSFLNRLATNHAAQLMTAKASDSAQEESSKGTLKYRIGIFSHCTAIKCLLRGLLGSSFTDVTMGTSTVLARFSIKWLTIAVAVALASVAALHAIDNFYVVRHPPVCAASAERELCVSEYRIARRSLGAAPASTQQVTAAMIESARVKVAAGLELVKEIQTANAGRSAEVEAVSDDCVTQVSAALAQLEKSSSAISAGSNVLDLPYWLQTAQTQLSNCLSTYRELAPSALSTPTGVYLASESALTKSTLVAAIDLTSQAAAAARSSRGRQALENGGESNGHPEWLEAGLYEQLKELQAHMQGDHDSAQEWAEKRRGLLGLPAPAEIPRRELKGGHPPGVGHHADLWDNGRRKGGHPPGVGGHAHLWKNGKKRGGNHPPGIGGHEHLWKNGKKVGGNHPKGPDAVVGRGEQYSSVKSAVDAAPAKGRFVIYIKAGTYDEVVQFDNEGIIFVGDGPDRTIITGSKSMGGGSGTTFKSATVGANRDNFVALGVKFVNTAGRENEQAVAMRASGDASAFFECAFEAFQDTLYVDAGRQYYKNCYVGGTIDFIFGDAAVVLDSMDIRLHTSHSFVTITASGRDTNGPTGIVIRNSKISTDPGVTDVYLGRPWKDCARVVYVDTYLPAELNSDGWSTWGGDTRGSCVYYAEKGSTGPGARTSRASWVHPGIISDASQFDPEPFVDLSSWLDVAGKNPKW
ncbi:unnamed protein product [Closterium sp. Yama58-4]|nr:unnamed protein product [Closterium sp. Yama58-4]